MTAPVTATNQRRSRTASRVLLSEVSADAATDRHETDPIPVTSPHATSIRATNAMGVPLDETTIYRTVTRLEQLDLIHHVTIPDQANRYGLNTPTHHRALDRTQL
jgi:hypothetical protein